MPLETSTKAQKDVVGPATKDMSVSTEPVAGAAPAKAPSKGKRRRAPKRDWSTKSKSKKAPARKAKPVSKAQDILNTTLGATRNAKDTDEMQEDGSLQPVAAEELIKRVEAIPTNTDQRKLDRPGACEHTRKKRRISPVEEQEQTRAAQVSDDEDFKPIRRRKKIACPLDAEAMARPTEGTVVQELATVTHERQPAAKSKTSRAPRRTKLAHAQEQQQEQEQTAPASELEAIVTLPQSGRTNVDYNKFKVVELKAELKKRCIPLTKLTRKQDMINTLMADDVPKQPKTSTENSVGMNTTKDRPLDVLQEGKVKPKQARNIEIVASRWKAEALDTRDSQPARAPLHNRDSNARTSTSPVKSALKGNDYSNCSPRRPTSEEEKHKPTGKICTKKRLPDENADPIMPTETNIATHPAVEGIHAAVAEHDNELKSRKAKPSRSKPAFKRRMQILDEDGLDFALFATDKFVSKVPNPRKTGRRKFVDPDLDLDQMLDDVAGFAKVKGPMSAV